MKMQLQLGGYDIPQSVLEPCDPKVRMRRGIEYVIVRKLVEDFRAKGFTLLISYCGGSEDITIPDASEKSMLELFACDEEQVHIFRGEENMGWVKLVYGNDGWDVISDYTTNLEEWMGPVLEFADAFC